MKRPNILIIEEDPQIQQKLKSALKSLALRSQTEGSISKGLRAMKTDAFDLVLLNIRLRGSLTALKHIIEQRPDINIILTTDRMHPEFAAEAMKLGATDFLLMQFAPSEIRKRIEQILKMD